MVGHRMPSRHGGSRGGRRPSQNAQGANQSSHHASQSAFNARTPPSSPSRRPFPYHAFQNYHFRFQSNLVRPIISANISIIFTEEESQPLASVSTMGDTSQEDLRIVDGHGSAHQPGEAGQASKQSGLQTANMETDDVVKQGGSIHGAEASVEDDGSSSSSPQAEHPPDGSGEGEAEHGEDDGYGNACLVEEMPLDQNVAI